MLSSSTFFRAPQRRAIAVALLCAVVATTACSSNGAVVSTIETTSTLVESTSPQMAKRGNPEMAWDAYVEQFVVQDVSTVSKSDCGVFAMLVTEESLTFYEWNGEKWNDISTQLGTSRGRYPLKVYSQDFTNDGVIDFFVTYEDERRRGRSTYGAFFAFPWSGENECVWNWVDIDNGRDITKIIESPEVDQRKARVYASGYKYRRAKTYGEVKYLPASSSFIFEEVFKK
jgi:hypothetical protein